MHREFSTTKNSTCTTLQLVYNKERKETSYGNYRTAIYQDRVRANLPTGQTARMGQMVSKGDPENWRNSQTQGQGAPHTRRAASLLR
jgi:hypothetical protein